MDENKNLKLKIKFRIHVSKTINYMRYFSDDFILIKSKITLIQIKITMKSYCKINKSIQITMRNKF